MLQSNAIPAARAPRAQPMPRTIAPMLALLASHLPDDQENWAFEHKWDGVRALCFWDGSTLSLHSRNQLDITSNYPELRELGAALGKKRVILDGEIIAPDLVTGLPDFSRLSHRMHVAAPTDRLRERVPICYMLFDVLYRNGRSTMQLPYERRRELLEELTLRGPCWSVTSSVVGEGEAMLAAARNARMEGIVAKRLDSLYEPGRRSPAWKKLKVIFGQEFVIGGWAPEAGGRDGRIGSLLVGYYDCPARGRKAAFRYAGTLGSGYSDSTHAQLVPLLEKLARADSPFADKVPSKAGMRFMKPVLVAETQYRRWPATGTLQQASFKGLRDDKKAREVVKETEPC